MTITRPGFNLTLLSVALLNAAAAFNAPAAPPARDDFTVHPEVADQLRPVFQKLKDEKIRFGYGGADALYRTDAEPIIQNDDFDPGRYSFELAGKMKQAGFNGLMLLFGPWRNGFGELPRLEKAVRFWAEGCRRHDLSLMVDIQFAQNAAAYRRFHAGTDLKIHQAVCPHDWKYWEEQILERCLITAKVAKDFPNVLGAALDFEMYIKDGANYPGPCLCDVCFAEFCRRTGSSSPVTLKPTQRQEWIRDQQKLLQYMAYMEWKMAETCSRLEKAVHAVNPDFVFAYLPFFEWFPGSTRGLGTPSQPVLVSSEMEYTAGFSPAVAQRTARMKDEGYPALYLPALWLQQHDPATIAGQVYALTRDSDGFWFYTMGSLWKDEYDSAKGDSALFPGSRVSDYWQAFRQAFTALDQRRQQGEAYVPPFPIPPKQDATLPSLSLSKSTTPLLQDGRFSPQAWSNAQNIILRDNYTSKPYQPKTTAWIAFDQDFIIVKAQADEPELDKIKTATTSNGDFKVFSDDMVELYFGFENNAIIRHFGINAAGVYAVRTVYRQGNDRTWECQPIVSASRTGQAWILEMAFPWRQLAPDGAIPAEICFNLNRVRSLPGDRLAAWSPTFGLFLAPDRFGRVTLQP
ncbi:MAG TPA: sugar-binding protein [Lentisphaeria bacterium]|mgnify:CR=1 FL=1|nr:sugar-binding protein [Lentisphaeria bacterium]